MGVDQRTGENYCDECGVTVEVFKVVVVSEFVNRAFCSNLCMAAHYGAPDNHTNVRYLAGE